VKATDRWFGNAAHFICGQSCRFHLATQVGPWLVSTVGQMWSARNVREIHAKVHDAAWLAANVHRKGDDFDAAYFARFGYEEIGCDRTYETMVFRAGKPCRSKDCGCGLPTIDGSERDFAGYNNAKDATAGHMKMLAKWRRKKETAK
jgi:hypothetical protein